MSNFGDLYSGYYDLVYADKDYINLSPLRIREDNGDFFYENERVSKNSLLHYSSEGVVYQVSNKTVILDGIAASLKEGNKNRFPETPYRGLYPVVFIPEKKRETCG